MFLRFRLVLLFLSLCRAALAASPSAAFELRTGDRVVFLGDGLIEGEQYQGWVELMLTSRFAERAITFRNLGWNGDTPAGDSRFGRSLLQAGKEPADEGWRQLVRQIEEEKPTVVFVGYGMSSSFAGAAGLVKFKADYGRLLDAIGQASPGARLVLLSPIPHENLGAPWPDGAAHNAQLALYARAVGEIAAERRAHFIPLFEVLSRRSSGVAGVADPGDADVPPEGDPGSASPATPSPATPGPATPSPPIAGARNAPGYADSAKLDTFQELLAEAVDDGHRVLVFSQFTSLLALLRPELEAQGIAHCYLDGSMSPRARQAEVDRFQASSDIPVFLLSLKAGGTGLNLTGADTVVHFDPWWNPAAEAQATDRAHRIGQQRVVTSYKLITAGTVEEKVLALQAEKRALLAGVFEASDAIAAKLSLADLQALLK